MPKIDEPWSLQKMQVTSTLNFNKKDPIWKKMRYSMTLTVAFFEEQSCGDDERLVVARVSWRQE